MTDEEKIREIKERIINIVEVYSNASVVFDQLPDEILSLVEIKSDDQSLPKDYIWPQTCQTREAMRQYQSGEISKEMHNIMQSRIHGEELVIYVKAQQDMLKPDSEGKVWVRICPRNGMAMP